MTLDGDGFGGFNEGRFHWLNQVDMGGRDTIMKACRRFFALLDQVVAEGVSFGSIDSVKF